MTQLSQIQLEDGTIIYIETNPDIEITSSNTPIPEAEENLEDEEEEVSREELGKAKGAREVFDNVRQRMQQTGARATQPVVNSFEAIEQTIKAYTSSTLNAFKQVKSSASIDKVTLEFGIKVGAEAAIPYITKGTAESNLKIQVECSFPKDKEDSQEE